MSALYDRLVIPEDRRSTSLQREQAEFISSFLGDLPITRTLETGFAYGCSAAHIMMATSAPHIAVDPYEEGYGNIGLANISRLGLQARFCHINLPSHVALPQILGQGVAIDFALIDGGHKFDEIFLDWYYIDRLLNLNGHVMFDDSWLAAVQAVAAYIRTNRREYREIRAVPQNMLLFQKTGRDASIWTDFIPFADAAGQGTP